MKPALLIIDVQQALCTGAEAAFDMPAVLERINALSARARAAGVPVVLVQHEDEGPLQYGTDGWQLAQGLSTQPGDLRIRKQTPDSFHETDLHAALQQRGVTHVAVCGLQSDYCIDSTVRRAVALGYQVLLAGDAHSTTDNRVLTAARITAHHNATLANIRSFGCAVRVLPAADISLRA
jgi:nicotinamidase-related amidase